MYLTDRKIIGLNCPPGVVKTAIRDQLSPGLVIEISAASKSKLFRFRYRFRGEEQSISIGSTAKVPLEEARQLVHRFRSQIDSGIDPKTIIEKKVKHLRFSEFATSIYIPLERSEKN